MFRLKPIQHIQKRSFFGFFSGWTSGKTIYPPHPSQFTTQNRIYPNYVTSHNELNDLILVKHPLILNFTVQADPNYNKLTSTLFDILSDKSKYPLGDFEVHLANITCDSLEAKDIMMTYGVNKLPSLVRLEKQLVVDVISPNLDTVSDQTVIEWLKTFKG
ncbi:hypothetical protein PSN45_003990 [Yamadazyma tenuis]|uniref:Thioredoxin domain-containing protein n=1 Tax=Candida tenuis (strain ATCC 10573 / BCRC 21748 / CBS 615 / JCM 9827 / NBRC 10315 / NRRL Y-1498 / VKM Y-70) TaxID=590646 RepID=G3B4A2_CANTC|nr:uncharacterized protein CANTEDRAFT_104949 [Yamadazyma tenuis ATCC 10573]EGV63933.1 hypothetical protein CANTEDRAFT_104949 [Yamadazyma tenuis ATCC 10573]WEJ96451.1 hypothetical protein PSN45_003990 [Yamadazyma tenuis]